MAETSTKWSVLLSHSLFSLLVSFLSQMLLLFEKRAPIVSHGIRLMHGCAFVCISRGRTIAFLCANVWHGWVEDHFAASTVLCCWSTVPYGTEYHIICTWLRIIILYCRTMYEHGHTLCSYVLAELHCNSGKKASHHATFLLKIVLNSTQLLEIGDLHSHGSPLFCLQNL